MGSLVSVFRTRAVKIIGSIPHMSNAVALAVESGRTFWEVFAKPPDYDATSRILSDYMEASAPV